MFWPLIVITMLSPTHFTRRLAIVSALSIVPTQKAYGDSPRLAPPPVEGTLSYDEFLHYAKAGYIDSIQIAMQHNCLAVTMNTGKRIALMIRDKDVPGLILDATEKDKIPFSVIPIDKNKQKIRTAWISFVLLYSALEILG
tara:strand:+ start:553 stop:975 length:423 start_codon:yes stop_codon:yes gene_type:complete